MSGENFPPSVLLGTESRRELEVDWRALSYIVQRLFTPAAPISRHEMFAGRKSQLRRLMDAVNEVGRHAVLYGERGVGKTSIANIFAEVASGNGTTDYFLTIRKQASPQDSFSDLWRKVFRELSIEFRREQVMGFEVGQQSMAQHASISDLYPDNIVADDVVRELQRVSDRAPIIIFDEFDKLSNIEAKKLMSHTIKAVSDTGTNATIILVGVADDINMLVDEHQSITRNIAEIKMPRMTRDELNEVLDGRFSKAGITIESDARRKIVLLSRGLPEYVHALGRAAAISAIGGQRLHISEVDVDTAIRETLQQSDQSASNAYRRAIDSNKKNALYQQVLLACAVAKPDDEGKFAAKDVVAPLSNILKRHIDIANFQSHLAAFCGPDRGSILERHGRERAFKYRFREPKMQPFVIMQGIAAGMVDSAVLSVLSARDSPLTFEF